MGLNKAILVGRLTRDPEVRYTTSNRAVAQFTVAIDRPFTKEDGTREADFLNVVAWDKIGENVSKYLTKGRLCAVEGRIQTRNYDNDEGRKVYVTEIIASNVQFLERKQDNINFENMPEPPMQEQKAEEKDPFEAFGQAVEISDSELPF